MTTWQYPLKSGIVDVIDDVYYLKNIPGRTLLYKPVVAASAGRVITAIKAIDGDAAGLRVVISHIDGTNTYYQNLSIVKVSVGMTVAAGQEIGLVGGSGATSKTDYPPRLLYMRKDSGTKELLKPFGARELNERFESLRWDTEPNVVTPVTAYEPPIIRSLEPTTKNVSFAVETVVSNIGHDVANRLGETALNGVAKLLLGETQKFALEAGIFPERLNTIGKDLLSGVAKEVLGNVIGPQLRNVLGNVSSVEDIGKLGTALLSDLSAPLAALQNGNVLSALPGLISSQLSQLGQVGQIGAMVFDSLGNLSELPGKLLGGLGAQLGNQLGNILNIGNIPGLGNLANLATTALGSLGAQLGSALGNIGNLGNLAASLPAALGQLGQNVLGGLGNLFSGGGSALQAAFGNIGGALTGALGNLGGALQGLCLGQHRRSLAGGTRGRVPERSRADGQLRRDGRAGARSHWRAWRDRRQHYRRLGKSRQSRTGDPQPDRTVGRQVEGTGRGTARRSSRRLLVRQPELDCRKS
jgi:hypothetical protein